MFRQKGSGKKIDIQQKAEIYYFPCYYGLLWLLYVFNRSNCRLNQISKVSKGIFC